MNKPVRERGIRSGAQREVQRRPLRRRRPARIGHDQRAAIALLRFEVPHDRRHRLRHVSAHQQNHVSARHVLEWKRQAAIDAQRLRGAGGRRRHAESAVVVDVRRSERNARELSQQVRLLVGQRAAAKHAHSVAAVGRLRRIASQMRCDRSPLPRTPDRVLPPHCAQAASAVDPGWRSVAAAVQPFRHRPPSLTGNLVLPAISTRSPSQVRSIPH